MDFLNRRSWKRLGMFDLIVSNPPYVRNLEKDTMSKNVLNYEPQIALFVDNNNPLVFYKAIHDFAQDHLSDHGRIYCEINHGLAAETFELFEDLFHHKLEIRKDFYERDRFLFLVRQTKANLQE
jgi:release factor glutamine methyltransferase